MIDLASKALEPDAVTYLWRDLRMGRCFEPICIDKALAALAQAENAVARKGTAEQKTSDGQETAEHGEQKQLVASARLPCRGKT